MSIFTLSLLYFIFLVSDVVALPQVAIKGVTIDVVAPPPIAIEGVH